MDENNKKQTCMLHVRKGIPLNRGYTLTLPPSALTLHTACTRHRLHSVAISTSTGQRHHFWPCAPRTRFGVLAGASDAARHLNVVGRKTVVGQSSRRHSNA